MPISRRRSQYDLSLVVAVADNGVIGNVETISLAYRRDMQHSRRDMGKR